MGTAAVQERAGGMGSSLSRLHSSNMSMGSSSALRHVTGEALSCASLPSIPEDDAIPQLMVSFKAQVSVPEV